VLKEGPEVVFRVLAAGDICSVGGVVVIVLVLAVFVVGFRVSEVVLALFVQLIVATRDARVFVAI
jgi:hypothetical protein